VHFSRFQNVLCKQPPDPMVNYVLNDLGAEPGALREEGVSADPKEITESLARSWIPGTAVRIAGLREKFSWKVMVR
jgi:hypothetical protein